MPAAHAGEAPTLRGQPGQLAMQREQWLEVARVYDAVFQADPARRPALLDSLCPDPEIRQEVESLLAVGQEALARVESQAARSAARFQGLAAQAASPREEEFAAGARLASYRITGLIGSGGMGAVYSAERADGQFEARAAIKVVSPLFAGAGWQRRFQLEKQALARLRHPNIAQLLDAGVTAAGRPFLVMELVEGLPMDQYCRRHGLDLRARIHLFLEICAAVEYAHQNLIVHRDLKPANILVTQEGRPKLLDFGIAKMLTDADSLATLPHDRVMTLAYASPEQVRGEAVSTASDTYSLGLLLYELLADCPSVQAAQGGLTEAVRRVCEWEPPPPSRAARSPKWGKELAGDLDTIVLKAIRKEPAGRYASASALAADLKNFLDGRPVAARQPTLWYRAEKFIRRNRLAAAAAAAVCATVLAATISVWRQAEIARRERAAAIQASQLADLQRRRAVAAQALAVQQRQAAETSRAAEQAERKLAEARFRDVRELANAVLFQYQARLARSGGETELRAQMARDSIAYLDRLAASGDPSPELRVELARGYIQVAGLLGVPNVPNLGDRDGARKSFTKARAVLAPLAGRTPPFMPAEAALAEAACMQIPLDPSWASECVSRREVLRQAQPSSFEALRGLAQAYSAAAATFPPSSDHAVNYRTRAIEICVRLLHQRPEDLGIMYNLALDHKSIAGNYGARGDLPAMLRHIQQALKFDEMRLSRSPDAPGVRLDLSFDLSMLGTYYSNAGEHAKALEQFRRAHDLRAQNLEKDPSNSWLQGRVLYARIAIASTLRHLGSLAAAADEFLACLEFARKYAPSSPDGGWRLLMWRLHQGRTLVLKELHRPAGEVCESARTALSHFENAGRVEPGDQELAKETRNLADACAP